MEISRISLKNFRNYEKVDFDFVKQKTLIIGKNAQGKTNILESIYLLSDLKSPRTSVFSEMVKFNADNFELKANIIKNSTDIEMEISYSNDKKRVLKINGLKTNPKNFKSCLKTVLFSTKDLLLMRGTPQDRRDWLDRAIVQIYPAYDERLGKYDKIRVQKNNLLKSDVIDNALLDIYNEQLAITGANIIYLRKKYLKEIEKIAKNKHYSISNSENFSMQYLYCGEEIDEIKENLTKELNERRSEEIARHQSCVGPHRDDINFQIDSIDAVKFASQGQQRTLVLALKLSELELIKEKTGETPILLLDDVLAELDEARQNFLLKSINDGIQTIITSVDTLLFEDDFLSDIQIYSIDSGVVKFIQ